MVPLGESNAVAATLSAGASMFMCTRIPSAFAAGFALASITRSLAAGGSVTVDNKSFACRSSLFFSPS